MLVITFNLRFENDQDGENCWINRRGLVVEIVERYMPALLATQEGKWSQLSYLRDHLPNYEIHATGRIVDSTCQYPTLFFRKPLLESIAGGEFWLSKTPGIHRSKSWDSAFPRMLSWARIRMIKDSKTFYGAVTHLDHLGVVARHQQAKMIRAWVRKRSGPGILLGDFNDRPGSVIHQLLTSRGTGLLDSWQVLGYKEGSESGTHHAFEGISQNHRIDWILVTPHFRVVNAWIIKDHLHGRYPSDHFPYAVELELKAPR